MSGTTERLYGRLMSLVGIARITASQALGGRGVRRYQARFDGEEIRDNTQAVQQYGLASRALSGADAVVIFLGGDRSSGIIIGVNDRRYQLELAAGEVALHDDQGQKIHLTRAGIVVDGGTGKLPILLKNTSGVTVDAPLHCTKTITADEDVKVGSRTLLHHKHTNGNGGGLTGDPV